MKKKYKTDHHVAKTSATRPPRRELGRRRLVIVMKADGKHIYTIAVVSREKYDFLLIKKRKNRTMQ